MDNKYKISPCPFCRQGNVEIVKEKSSQNLFLYCDECEIEWDSPFAVINKEKGTRNKYGEITTPLLKEIIKEGWESYLVNQ